MPHADCRLRNYTIAFQNLFCAVYLVAEVNVERPNITVPEGALEVEICVVLTPGVPEQVTVTAVTGPKSETANPATGRLYF